MGARLLDESAGEGKAEGSRRVACMVGACLACCAEWGAFDVLSYLLELRRILLTRAPKERILHTYSCAQGEKVHRRSSNDGRPTTNFDSSRIAGSGSARMAWLPLTGASAGA